MRQGQEIFLTLLRASLWDRRLECRLGKEEFRSAWTDAKRQAVRGLVGHAMLTSESLPSKVAEKVQTTLFSIARQNMKVDHLLAEAVKALREQGVETILLKGQGVAAFCHEPYLRESGDIDLYVGQQEYRHAFAILASMPGARAEDGFEAEKKHSHIEIDGTTIEIHRFCEVLSPKYNEAFQRIADECLSVGGRSFPHERPTFPFEKQILVFEGVNVHVPEPTFNALFVFNHLWRHFAPIGVGFRQVCDWTLLLDSCSGVIDRGRLKSYLEELGLMRPWQVFGSIAVDSLGLSPDKMPFYEPAFSKKASKVVEMMLEEGNFGHERKGFWAVSRSTMVGKIKVFMLNSFRHFRLIPLFGHTAVEEYVMRVRKHI